VHCTLVAFAMFMPPAICDLESQNKSVTFPPITVRGVLAVTAAVDRLTTTKPPWPLPVMLDPANAACELFATRTPWPELPEITRLAPAFKVELSETKTAALFPPHGCPAFVIWSLTLPRLSDELFVTRTPLKLVPAGLLTITSRYGTVPSK